MKLLVKVKDIQRWGQWKP